MCLCIKSVHGNTKRLCLPHSHKQEYHSSQIWILQVSCFILQSLPGTCQVILKERGEWWLWTELDKVLFTWLCWAQQNHSQRPPQCLGAGPCYVDTSGLQSKLCPLAKAGQQGQPHPSTMNPSTDPLVWIFDHTPPSQKWPIGLLLVLSVTDHCVQWENWTHFPMTQLGVVKNLWAPFSPGWTHWLVWDLPIKTPFDHVNGKSNEPYIQQRGSYIGLM